jgi:hypothetical protein
MHRDDSHQEERDCWQVLIGVREEGTPVPSILMGHTQESSLSANLLSPRGKQFRRDVDPYLLREGRNVDPQ